MTLVGEWLATGSQNRRPFPRIHYAIFVAEKVNSNKPCKARGSAILSAPKATLKYVKAALRPHLRHSGEHLTIT